MTSEKVGKLIKCIHNLIMKNASVINDPEQMKAISPMQGWILGFLYFHRDQVIYQKTLETEFDIPKSTLATMLKQLCDKGYVIRESAEHDTRLKRISLSEKGCQVQAEFIRSFRTIDQYMCEGIPEEDLRTFLEVGSKIKDNLKNHINHV